MPIRATLAVLLLTLALSPHPAAAQAPLSGATLELDATPPAPVEPLRAWGNASLTIRYAWEPGGATHPDEPVTIVLSAVHPGSIQVALTPAVLEVRPQPGATTSVTLQALASVSAHANASADEPIPVTIRAVANATGTLKPATAETTFEVTVKPYTILEARIDQPILIVRSDEPVTFAGTLLNGGNAKVQVRLTATAPEGVEVNVPEPVILGPAMDPETSTQPFTVTARTIDGEHEVHPISLRFEATPLASPGGGDTAELTVILTRRTFLPAPTGALTLAALGLAALAAILARHRQYP